MVKQGSLFLVPLARRSDPTSSHEAARRVAPKANSQAGKILATLRYSYGGVAMTAEEVATALSMHPYEVRKRLPDLERLGYVVAINRDNMAPGDVLRWRIR